MTNFIVDTAVVKKLKALGALHGVKFTADYGVSPTAGKWTAIIVTFKHNDKKLTHRARTNIWPNDRAEALKVAQAGVDALVDWMDWFKKGTTDVEF